MKAENALKPGDVELTKVDDIDGTALEGAVFKIVDANDEKKVIRENIKTGADGKAIATDLRPGDYKFIEVTAPKYYDKIQIRLNLRSQKVKRRRLLLPLKQLNKRRY